MQVPLTPSELRPTELQPTELRPPDLLPEPAAAPDVAGERARSAMVLGAIFCLGVGAVLVAAGWYLQAVLMLGVASVCCGLALKD
jgi:hypothetical protein